MTQKEKKDYADAILKLFEASIDNPTAGPRLLSNYRESILALTPKQKEEIAEYLFDRSAQLFLQYHSSRGLHHISGVTHYDELIKKSEEFFEVCQKPPIIDGWHEYFGYYIAWFWTLQNSTYLWWFLSTSKFHEISSYT